MMLLKTGRGVGKAFARCHEVARYVELGYSQVLCKVTNRCDVYYIKPMLQQVLQEYSFNDIKFLSSNKLLVNQCIIQFICEIEWEYKTKGLTDFVEVLMQHQD